MKQPRIKLNTDDGIFMNSQLDISVAKELNIIEFEHLTQHGNSIKFYVYRRQIDRIVKFLQESKEWIDSGYKDKLKPESHNDFKPGCEIR